MTFFCGSIFAYFRIRRLSDVMFQSIHVCTSLTTITERNSVFILKTLFNLVTLHPRRKIYITINLNVRTDLLVFISLSKTNLIRWLLSAPNTFRFLQYGTYRSTHGTTTITKSIYKAVCKRCAKVFVLHNSKKTSNPYIYSAFE